MGVTNVVSDVLAAQLTYLFRTVEFLQDHIENDQSTTNLVKYMMDELDNEVFLAVRDNCDVYTAKIYAVDSGFAGDFGIDCKKMERTKVEVMKSHNQFSDHALCVMNYQKMLYLYSKLLIEYYNALCVDNEPRFGVMGRQIPFAHPGATVNQAWWAKYRYLYIVSMNSFAKLLAAPYSARIALVKATVNVYFIMDMVAIECGLENADKAQGFIEPY